MSIDTLSKSDPNFPAGWRNPPRSPYFWVVAQVGSFTVEPHSFAGPESPETFHVALEYLQATNDPSDPETLAHPCRSIGGSMTTGPWPAWFDRMPALDDVKIR